MIKVFFTCPWENSKSLLNKLKKNTPGCKGIWKNVIGTLDIEHSDFIVILDDLNISLTRLGIHNFMRLVQNMNKLIYFQRENTAILNKANKSWFCQRILPVLKHKYSFEDDFFYTFTTAHFLNKTYDELKNMEYPTKNNNISCVVSSKNFGKTYEDRKKFIKTYSNIYDNKIDIFGRGWDKNELGDNYKGELGSYHQQSETSTSKLDGLISYNYSICLENYPNEKVTSEKITDCLLCWCMPIYSGSVDTNKYYPSDAFHLIDIKEDNIYEKVYEMSSQDVTQKNIDAIREARNLILDTYNIWEQIYQISKDRNKFIINYNFNLTLYFCHYPKTGGTYVKNLIYNVSNGVDHITQTHIDNSYIAKELRIKNIKIIILSHDINYLKYKKRNTLLITTVRHPITIIQSYYSHGQLGLGNVLQDKSIDSFDAFINLFINNNPYTRFEDKYFYKNMFVNNNIIFDIVFKLESIENDFKNFLTLCGIDSNRVNFNVNNYNRNNYIFKEWKDIEKRNHKTERKNGIVIRDEIKQKLYTKFKFYFDYFNYN